MGIGRKGGKQAGTCRLPSRRTQYRDRNLVANRRESLWQDQQAELCAICQSWDPKSSRRGNPSTKLGRVWEIRKAEGSFSAQEFVYICELSVPLPLLSIF